MFKLYCVCRQGLFLKGSDLFVFMCGFCSKTIPEVNLNDFIVMMSDFQKRYLELISGKKVEDFLGK